MLDMKCATHRGNCCCHNWHAHYNILMSYVVYDFTQRCVIALSVYSSLIVAININGFPDKAQHVHTPSRLRSLL